MRYIVLFLLLAVTSKAQVVSYVDKKHEADLIVFDVDYRFQSDIVYFVTEHRYEAKGGVWYVSDKKEGIKLYVTKYKHEADLLIFEGMYEHEIKGRIDEQ